MKCESGIGVQGLSENKTRTCPWFISDNAITEKGIALQSNVYNYGIAVSLKL